MSYDIGRNELFEQVDVREADIRSPEELAATAWVDQCADDAVECFERRRGIVNYPLFRLPPEDVHREVRRAAWWGARLALGLQRNGDRLDRFGGGDPPAIWQHVLAALGEEGE
jgi:hypothetical protein